MTTNLLALHYHRSVLIYQNANYKVDLEFNVIMYSQKFFLAIAKISKTWR